MYAIMDDVNASQLPDLMCLTIWHTKCNIKYNLSFAIIA